MAFQAVPDTVEIDVIYTLNAETVQNVFYAELPGGYALADLVALAFEVDARVSGNFKAQQPLEAIYVRTEVRGLAFPNDITATNNTSTGPGTDVSPAMPNNVTIAIKKNSGLTGRSARGRTYWIGIPRIKTDGTNENFLIAAYVTALEAAIDQIRLGIATVGLWEPVLVSRFTGGLPRTVGLTFPWVSSTAVDARVDSQRGRLP